MTTARAVTWPLSLLLACGSCGSEVRSTVPQATGVGAGGTGGTQPTGGAPSVGGAGECVPSSTVECYSGPSATKDVGICKAGSATCMSDGSGYGPCENEVLPALEDCATTEDEDCNGVSEACAPGSPQWVKRFGQDGTLAEATEVVTDTNGDVIVLGTADGAIDLGGGPLAPTAYDDIVLVRLDGQGAHLWSRRFGSALMDEGWSIAIAPGGNIVFAAHFGGNGPIDFGGGPLTGTGMLNGAVVQLDAQGNHLWSKTYNVSGTTMPRAVVVDAAGDIVLAGMFEGVIDFGGGPETSSGMDVFVVKLTPLGDQVWIRTFGSNGDEDPEAMAMDGAGNLVLAGTYNGGNPDFGGGTLPMATDGSFVVKLNASGDHLWSKGFGSQPNTFHPRGLKFTTTGNVLVSGDLKGTVNFGGGAVTSSDGDAAIVGFTSLGPHWADHVFPGAGDQRPWALARDAADNIAVCGDMYGDVNFGGGLLVSPSAVEYGNMFVAKLTSSGAHVFSRLPLVSGEEMACFDTTFDPAGRLVATGSFTGTMDFGNGAMSSLGYSDIFVAKLHP